LPTKYLEQLPERLRAAVFGNVGSMIACRTGAADAPTRLRRAIVAVARKLAIIMHRMWVDHTTFNWARETVALA